MFFKDGGKFYEIGIIDWIAGYGNGIYKLR